MSTELDARALSREIHALALFRPLLDGPVLGGLLALLENEAAPEHERIDTYCAFVAALYAAGGDLGAHLLNQVLECENPVVRLRARNQRETPEMAAALATELELFTRLSALAPAAVAALAGPHGNLPAFASTPQDFTAVYVQRLSESSTRGYGIFAAHHMFTLGEGATLLPVKNPDPQRLSDLTGYENERKAVLLNTRALLKGLAANNILLYGDAGTGKSSTVKAIGNEFAPQGLRLVEVRKNQLYQIPLLMDSLAENPLKFVLFIDDLSFPADDAGFTALKAILEGNISARPSNIVVYATSNRRHMVKQHFADRADEVSLNDTLEEEASLSARFGLTITFLKPDRALYQSIVAALAEEFGLKTPPDALMARAETHAIRHGGRSPRTARQFVELMRAEELIEGE
ncbi:ATP-binding protein [Ruminococcaceae bacterium OttesenSCG-928-D13]|nr:ATP-binding protein [Ruminococcaceae bacterium OttesenSCG-928-D13]